MPMIRELCFALLLATGAPQARGGGLEHVVDLPLPGPTGRFDYLAFDTGTGRLYIDAMAAGQVVVFDVRQSRLDSVLSGFPSATGISLARSRGLAFVSVPGRFLDRAAGRGRVCAIRLSDLSTAATLPAGGFPDGSAWAPESGKLFVSNERSGEETVVGTDPLRVLKTIPLGGEAGNTAYDPIGHRVLVAVQTRNEVVEIDPVSLEIVRRVRLPGTCIHDHGLLVDDAHNLLFIACDGNSRLLTLRLPDLRVLQTDPVGEDPDVLALDKDRGRLFVAAESGIVTVFAVSPAGLHLLWRGVVGPDAHSVAIDPGTGLAYFPLANIAGHPLLRVMRFVDR